MLINVNLKKIVFYLLLFLLVVFFAFCYTCFCLPLQGDEIWNYGFSYNISKGLVIYRDFNVLQTPIYFFIGSIFIRIFGNYLISLHLLDAVLIGILFIVMFKQIGFKAFGVYFILLLSAIPSYNLLCLLWLFLILGNVHKKNDNDILIGIFVSLLFLTKQNIGICIFLVYFLCSKNKLKAIISFFIPILILIIYFISCDSFYQFINYCFLGMLDFNEKNNNFVDITYVILEIFIIGYLIYKIIKVKGKDKTLYYVLAFQMLLYPIVDWYHFLICFVPVIYIIVRDSKFFVIYVSVISILFFCIFVYIPNKDSVYKENNFLYLRNNKISFSEIELAYNKYLNISDYQFFCFLNAYIYKLYLDIDINKYDLMLNGNMGFRGDKKYIEEIDEICKNNSCVFFINENMYDSFNNQFSKEIYDYVIKNYEKLEEYKGLNVYKN